MKRYKLNKLSAAISAMALLSGSYAAQANDNDSAESRPEVEETIVTGFRGSLIKSTELKREASSIVEAISSEDIGKLPEKSIAEALMRLPGLATQRINGRAQIISIRGMAPDFGTTLMNGRQQVSTRDSRSVEYDQYPAEFTSSAIVYKSPDASIVGQGISGTVDIRTVRPLDHDERSVSVNLRYEQNADEALNSDGTNKGNKATLTYIDQFADETLGVALGFSHTDTPIQGEKFNAWGYPEATDDDGNVIGYVIGGVKPFVQSVTLERDSFIGTIEYKPNDNFETSFDLFYSEFNEDQLLRGIELPLLWSSAQFRNDPGDYVVENGVIVEGTFDNVMGVIRSDATLTEADLIAGGWNSKLQLNDNWSLETDISYSQAERVTQVIENYTGYINGPDTLNFQTRSDGTRFESSLDYTNPDNIRITNLQSWGGTFVPSSEGGQKGYYSRPSSKDDLTQFRMTAERELSFSVFNAMQLGFNYDDRSKNVTPQPEYYFALPDNASQAPLPAQTALTDLSFIGFGSIISYDPLLPMRNGTYELVRAVRADLEERTWEVTEQITTLYARVEIDTELGSIPVRGNIGAQYIMTEQNTMAMSASGEAGDFESFQVSGGDEYNELLPSLNLIFDLTEEDSLRFGLARSLTRPEMNNMRASSAYGYNDQLNDSWVDGTPLSQSPWSSTAGNPELRPWIADNIDLSYEHYFTDDVGYFSAAIFYKSLDTYVYTLETVKDFTNYPQPDEVPNTQLGIEYQPANGEGGYVKGYELSLTLGGGIISDALDGFGVIFNYSSNDSSIEPENTPENALPGLSEKVHGAQLYFEKYGWSARVSHNYRSEFLGPLTSNTGEAAQRLIDETTLVDGQIGYKIQDGYFEGLDITLLGYNLNDEPFVTNETGDANRVVDYSNYGKSYALNFSYRF